ncbi:hypothetical protein HZC00_05040 [Candidatus Kaiserbacteria bacterium]|nr:hypothetical protein [Candidatus Kaiserbacteria bacterium]
MPPQQPQSNGPISDPDHLLPRHQKSSGPLFGTGIVIVLLLVGAFYFWGAELNRRNNETQLPLIPASDTTIPASVK